MSTFIDAEQSMRPEGLPDKFWDPGSGSVRMESLVKSYLQLKRRFDESPGDKPPDHTDDYEIWTDNAFVTVDPQLNERLHEAGFSQSQAQMVYDLADEYLVPLAGELASEFAAHHQVERLTHTFGGEDRWRQVSKQVSEWGRSRFPEEVFEALASTYDGVVAMYQLMEKDEPDLIGNAPATSGLTEDALKALMCDPRYWRDQDPALVRRVQHGFEDLYPG